MVGTKKGADYNRYSLNANLSLSRLEGLVKEGDGGAVVTHHAPQHTFTPSTHTGYTVIYLIAIMPILFSKKTELCSNKNGSRCIEEECTGREGATEMCGLLVEGVHRLSVKWEYVSLSPGFEDYHVKV